MLVQLFTAISAVFKKANVGLEIIEWSVGAGKEFVANKIAEIVMEYKRQNPQVTRSSTSVPEVQEDSMILVNRSIRPSYPDWMREVMHPELDALGPAEYEIGAVEQWLHDGQKDGKLIEGNKIYNQLKETDTLKTCLGLRDLEEIQKKNIAFFRKHFKGKAVFGWRSIVRNRGGNLSVPFLYEDGGEVVLSWRWVDDDWVSSRPALRFASGTKV